MPANAPLPSKTGGIIMVYNRQATRFIIIFTAVLLLLFGTLSRPAGVYAQRDGGKGMGKNNTELATLGGGCFWCLEAVFEQTEGIMSVVSGYAGGNTEDPSYEEVCGGGTGHAEVVQITFDPETVSYNEILDLFWDAHDPTTVNRQGADVGSQYRSIILYHDEEQRKAALKSKSDLEKSGIFSNPVVTEIVALDTFYPAEDYHQDYYVNNKGAPYCAMVIRPKLKKLGLEL